MKRMLTATLLAGLLTFAVGCDELEEINIDLGGYGAWLGGFGGYGNDYGYGYGYDYGYEEVVVEEYYVEDTYYYEDDWSFWW